jgi:mannosyltransferase
MTDLFNRAKGWWYALVPAALALIIGLRGLNSVGLWIDELYTVEAAQDGLGGQLNEAPELPYYALMRVWTLGGRWVSEDWVRLPSLLAVVAAALLVAATARRLSTPLAGLAAGLILAIAPGTQRYAQEARVYAIGLAFVTLATYALISATKDDHRRWWVLYASALAAGGLLLPVTFAVVPAHFVLLYRRPFWNQTIKRWMISCLSCAPVLLLESAALIRFSQLHSQDAFAPSINNLWQAATWLTSAGTIDTAAAAAFAIAVLLLGLLTPASTRWVLAAVAGSATIALVSFGPMSWWLGRSFLPLTGLLAVGAGLTLATLSVRRYAAVLAVMAVFVSPAYTEIRLPWSRGYDYRAAARIIDQQWQSGDDIAASSPFDINLMRRALNYYAAQPERFIDQPTAGGRQWIIDQAAPCDKPTTWDLGAGHTLELCE